MVSISAKVAFEFTGMLESVEPHEASNVPVMTNGKSESLSKAGKRIFIRSALVKFVMEFVLSSWRVNFL